MKIKDYTDVSRYGISPWNQKLKKVVEKQAEKFKMTTDELIWACVKRGLMSDGINKEKFKELHSKNTWPKLIMH